MHERRDEDTDRDSRQPDERSGPGHPPGEAEHDWGRGGRGGPDTRFLQLEMSRVLRAEADEAAKPAFRALLLEAAKDHLRARFGDTITRLARLAVDELVTDIEASLEIEERVQRRRASAGTDDRLRAALAREGPERRAPSPDERTQRRRPAPRGRRK